MPPNVNATFSRRAVLGVAAGGSVAAAARKGSASVTSAALTWLHIDNHARDLSRAWSSLESRAARELNWFQLSDAERQATVVGEELNRIEGALKALHRRRQRQLRRLTELRAGDLSGAAAKLWVAVRLLSEEDSQVAALVSGALRGLLAAHPETAASLGWRGEPSGLEFSA